MLGRSSLGSPARADAVRDEAHGRPRLRAGPEVAARGRVARGVPARARGCASLPLRLHRDLDVRRAAHVVTPSAYLRDLAVMGWGVRADRVTLLPNPAPPLPELAPREELRARLGIEGPTLAFAGRLTAQKQLDLGIEAARRAGVALLIAGDGPDRAALERIGYGRFLGPLPRRAVLELFRAADASLLSSAWENFPHTVVEALAVGTPVIATRTGGVAEVLTDEVNGLVVEPGDLEALTGGDRALLRRRGAGRAASRGGGAVGRRLRARAGVLAARADPRRGGGMIPRVLFVGRTRYRLPLPRRPRPQVGCPVGADGRTGDRERHRVGSSLPPRAAAPARRAALLLDPAGRGRARAALVPPGRDRRREPVRGCGRRGGAGARALAGEGRGRGARRLAGVEQPLRLAAARACCARRATRSRAGRSTTPTGTVQCRGFTASMLRERGHVPLGVFTTYSDLSAFTAAAGAGPERSPRALRGRARALQERRGPRGRLASGGAAGAGGASSTWSGWER